MTPEPTSHPEFPVVTATCPPGANPAPAKPAKAVSKVYYLTEGGVNDDGSVYIPDQENHPTTGFRTKEEMNKFARGLPPGEYTPIAVFSKHIIVSDVRRVKGV